MDFTATENIPSLMIFIDFQKAFDSVEWSFLIKCLEKLYFGPDFIRWVGVFYKDIKTVKNDHRSKFSNLSNWKEEA